MCNEPNVIREAKGIEFADEKRLVDCKWLKRYTSYETNGNIHLAAKYNGEYLDISIPIPDVLELIAFSLSYTNVGEAGDVAVDTEEARVNRIFAVDTEVAG